jgi:hypothetical protein
MRWNGVFLLGLGLTAIGFLAIAFVQVYGFEPEAAKRAMALSISVLACGALTACLGSLMGRHQREQPFRRARRPKLFTGQASKNGTTSRHFGQRAEYSALGRKVAQSESANSVSPLAITYQVRK